MIIVSQEEGVVINFNNIEAIGVGNLLNNNNGKFEIFYENASNNRKIIAKYSTKERAKEVLREITERYEYCQRLQENKGISLTIGNNYVYKMPKE